MAAVASCPASWAEDSPSVSSNTLGIAALMAKTYAFEETLRPPRKMALTPSPFHFSVKLWSWASEADVSPDGGMVSTADDPWAIPMASSAGLTTAATDAAESWSARVATFLPVRVPWALSRFINTVVRRSAVMSGVIINPGGAWLIHCCSSSWPMWMVWWSRLRHSWASPVKSKNTPSTAKTLSSSVNEVHSVSAWVFPIGQ